jgi:hypothetical protein
MALDVSQLNDLLYTLSDNDVVLLPSGKTAQVREMTGHEQRNFMNRAKLSNGTAIQELLAACTVSINDELLPTPMNGKVDVITGLLSVDRRALLFGIRRHSLGDTFMFSTQCPRCGDKGTWEVDVSDKLAFPITPCPNGDNRDFTYDSTVKLGVTIKFKFLDGAAEMAVLRKREAMDLLTDLEFRYPQVRGMKGDQDTWVPVVLNKVPDSIISELRRHVREQEGDIRTMVKVICAKCQSEVEFDLLQLPDFMTPSVIS